MATTSVKKQSSRRWRALHHFAETLEDEVQAAVDAAKGRQLAASEMVLQWAEYLHARCAVSESGALPSKLLRKPPGLAVGADLAAALMAIEPHLLEACMNQFRAALKLARPFDGKPFARKIISRLAEPSGKTRKTGDDEGQALARLEQAGSDLVQLFRRAAADLETEVTAAAKKPQPKPKVAGAWTLTPPQLAKEWGVDVDKIYAFIRSGELRATDTAIKRGGRPRYRIDRQDAEDFQRRRQNTPPPPRSPRRKKADAGAKRYY